MGPGTIKIFFAMSKNPRMQIMSSGGPGEPSFWYFCVGVSPEVWTFSGSTLKRLKWFFEAAFEPRDYQNIDLHVMEHHLDRLLYGFVHYESRFCHFTETCGSYPAHDVFNFHDVCKDRVVYPYFMPILILSVVFGSLRHLLVIISPYSMSTVIYFLYKFVDLSSHRKSWKPGSLGRNNR